MYRPRAVLTSLVRAPHAGPTNSPMNHKIVRSLFASFAIVLLCAGSAVSQTQERDLAKERLIWDHLKTIAPETTEDFKAATVAMDSGNYDEAIRLYRAVLKKAPDSHHVLRRLGSSLVMQGNLEEGLSFIEQAVLKNRSSDNLYALALFLAYPAENKEGTPDHKSQAFEIIKEAEFLPKIGDDPDVDLLLAQLAYDFGDMVIFRRATERLAVKHQELMATHYFKAVLAAHDADWATAETEIRRAEGMGLAPAVAQEFLSQTGIEGRRKTWRYAAYAGSVVGVWLVGLGALFVFGKLMSKRTLRSIEEADPNAGTSSADLGLRKWYRRLIGLAGIYYYISIPFVIFLVLGAAAAATYFSFVLGHIPIKWLFLIDLGACDYVLQNDSISFPEDRTGRSWPSVEGR
jgi:tetratricopeptide (TPR) repeat protein